MPMLLKLTRGTRGRSRIFEPGVQICQGGFELTISPTFSQNSPRKWNNLDSKGGSTEPPNLLWIRHWALIKQLYWKPIYFLQLLIFMFWFAAINFRISLVNQSSAIMEVLNFHGDNMSWKYLPRQYPENKSLIKTKRFIVLFSSTCNLYIGEILNHIPPTLISKLNASEHSLCISLVLLNSRPLNSLALWDWLAWHHYQGEKLFSPV